MLRRASPSPSLLLLACVLVLCAHHHDQMEKDGSWKPMWKKDSLALEDAVAKGLKTLLVEGGRYQVH